jgi:hypothetical protein
VAARKLRVHPGIRLRGRKARLAGGGAPFRGYERATSPCRRRRSQGRSDLPPGGAPR